MGKKLKKIKIDKSLKSVFSNKPLMLFVVVLVLAIIFSTPSIRTFLRMPSEAADIGGGTGAGNGLGTGTPVSPTGGLLPWKPQGTESMLIAPEENVYPATPKLYQNKLVYSKYKTNDPGCTTVQCGEIDIVNIDTGQATPIATGDVQAVAPNIYGNYVVYQETVSNSQITNVYLYNILNKTKTNITKNVKDGIYSGWPDIYGNNVVFETEYSTNYGWDKPEELNLYNIQTGVLNTLLTLPAQHDFQDRVAIYSNKVVYSEGIVTKTPNVKIYDINTGTNSSVSPSDLHRQLWPAIYNNLIVWQEELDGMSSIRDLVLYNLTDHSLQNITGPNFVNNWNPAIYSNFIVWEHQNGTSPWDEDIYIRRQDSSSVIMNNININQPLSLAKKDQTNADIFANRVVWTDYKYDNPATKYVEAGISLFVITNM